MGGEMICPRIYGVILKVHYIRYPNTHTHTAGEKEGGEEKEGERVYLACTLFLAILLISVMNA